MSKCLKGIPFYNDKVKDPGQQFIINKVLDEDEKMANKPFKKSSLDAYTKYDAQEFSEGKTLYMSPEDFLKLAAPLFTGGKAVDSYYKEQLEQGAKLDVPYLNATYDDKTGDAKIIGHEGRHRAETLIKQGVKSMPVRFRMVGREGERFEDVWWKDLGNMKTEFGHRIKKYPHRLFNERGTESFSFPVSKNKVKDNNIKFKLKNKTTFTAGRMSLDEAKIEYDMRKSGETQVPTTVGTYRKVKAKYFPSVKSTDILDYGAGMGVASAEMGFDSLEPNASGWTPKYTDASQIKKKYKGIIINNVLNVIPNDMAQRDDVVRDIGNKLAVGGKAFINVRALKGDVDKAKNPNPFDDGHITAGKGTFQKGFNKPELVEYLQDILGGGFVVTKSPLGAVGALITKVKEVSAPMERVSSPGSMSDQITNNDITMIGNLSFSLGPGPGGTENYHYDIISDDIYEKETSKGKSQQDSINKATVGAALMFRDANGKISGLTNLEIKPQHRKKGYGTKIIDAFKSSPADLINREFKIIDIKKNAVKFWKNLGAEIVEDSFAFDEGNPITNAIIRL